MTGLLVPAVLHPYVDNIQKALNFGGNVYTIEDVEELIATGKAQVWPGQDSVIVTEIISYPQAKHLHLFLAGGNLDELEAMLPEILDWGREQGCTRASLSGRRGWERSFLRDQGWKPNLVIMEKEI